MQVQSIQLHLAQMDRPLLAAVLIKISRFGKQIAIYPFALSQGI
jgi:hypothetical protein